jgi:hypothetical protein
MVLRVAAMTTMMGDTTSPHQDRRSAWQRQCQRAGCEGNKLPMLTATGSSESASETLVWIVLTLIAIIYTF